MIPRRHYFQRNLEYVAVQHIRLGGGHSIAPGTSMKGFKQYRMRAFHRRGQIGVVDTPWTKFQLERTAARTEKMRTVQVDEVKTETSDPTVPVTTSTVETETTTPNTEVETMTQKVSTQSSFKRGKRKKN